MNYSLKQRKQVQHLDKISHLNIQTKRNPRQALEDDIRRAFSPDPFKPSDKVNAKIKLLPILVKERTLPVSPPLSPLSPTSPGISIKLPEITGDGKFKYSEYFLPGFKSQQNFKCVGSENSRAMFARSSLKDSSLKEVTANFGSFVLKREKEDPSEEISFREI